MSNSRITFLFTATRSGGHILPALTVARELQRIFKLRYPQSFCDIHFVGTGTGLESTLIKDFPLHIVPMVGVKGRGLGGFIQLMLRLPRAILLVWQLLTKLKPAIVIGVGGYGSVLPIIFAKCRGIPTWIHELEVVPGLANKILAPIVDRVSIAFPNSAITGRQIEYLGHPVRPEILEVLPTRADRTYRLLVLGGSQGAAAIDSAVVQLAPTLIKEGIELWHQCRAASVNDLKQQYQQAGLNARVTSFIDNMAEAYSWSDAVLSRAGASAVMELSLVARPCILIPLASKNSKHQIENAQFLVSAGQALLVQESDDFIKNLESALTALFTASKYQEMLKAACVARPKDAATRIAEGCLSLIKNK